MYKLQIIPQCFTICIQFMYKTQDVAGQHTACLFTEIQIQKEIANFSAKQKIRSKTIGKRKCTALFLTNIQSHRQHCDQFIRQSSDSKYDQCEKKKKKLLRQGDEMYYKTLTATKEKKYLKILTTMCYLQGCTTQLISENVTYPMMKLAQSSWSK